MAGLLLACSLLLPACTTIAPGLDSARPASVATEAAVLEDPAGEVWWAFRFRQRWPADTPPDLSRDLLLAHALLAPLIADYEPVLGYWRFHRRAVRDAAGHQFSLIFYSTAGVAREMEQRLQASPLLQDLVSDGAVESFRLDGDSYRRRDRSLVAASSDPDWPPRLQQAWPAFIEGVSRTWLQLIDACVEPRPEPVLDELTEVYREADEEIRGLWQLQGQHAFLHHLSALFGYQPLLIRY